MPRFPLRLAALAGLVPFLVVAGLPAAAQVRDGHPPPATESRYTPAVLSIGASPRPVAGSDGRRHLVYELHVTNAAPAPLQIEGLEVLDGERGDVLLALGPGEVQDRMHPAGSRAPLGALQPAQRGVIFLHLPIEAPAPLPRTLAHRIRVSVPGAGIPPPLAALAALPPDAASMEVVGGRTEVGPANAVVIGPPLAGPRWLAADGCCTATRHVRALLPVNGAFFLAQRFAIDWERLDEDHRLFAGDPLDVRSYAAYDAPVLAVADAQVTRVVDGLPDQIPGELPEGITLAEADGNHVILDLGNGVYALYAHLIPGSITVAEGDRVRRGEVLARLGNSGNTSAPHLHFHLMDGPASLGSEGIPYVIDAFELTGRAPSTEAFDHAELHGTPLEVLPAEVPGRHQNALPLDQRVVTFPDAR